MAPSSVGDASYMNVPSSSDSEQFDPESFREESSRGRVWLRRLAFASVGVVAVVGACFTLSVARKSSPKSSKGRAYIPGSHPAFINYDALPVHRSLLGAPSLCDRRIVSKTCAILNQETTEYWQTRADTSLSEVHAMELSEALSISTKSIKAFFLKLGLTDTDTENADSFSVSCQELCEAVVGAFDKKQLPKASDVACIQLPFQDANCSVDVKPDALRGIKFPDGTTKSMKHHFAETAAMDKAAPLSKSEKNLRQKMWDDQKSMLQPDQPFDVVRNAVARQFRVFPKMMAEFSTAGDIGFEWFGPDEPKVSRRLQVSNWKATTLQAAAKGQAYINQALMHMNSRSIPAVVEKWFGRNDDNPTRAEVKRVLNGIQQMLDNVDYVYPGDECTPTTYAYVYPAHPWNKNSRGQFLFYLCDYYMSVDESERIETLTHEGSHHQPMYTKDTEYYYRPQRQDFTMYGRPICEYVADDCKRGVAEACWKVLTNADSLSYFINDAALAHAGQPGQPQKPTASTTTAPALGGILGSLR